MAFPARPTAEPDDASQETSALKPQAWAELAGLENGVMETRRMKVRSVAFPHGLWHIVLDTQSDGESSTTRMHVRFRTGTPMRLRIQRHNGFTRLATRFGLADLNVPNPEVDRLFRAAERRLRLAQTTPKPASRTASAPRRWCAAPACPTTTSAASSWSCVRIACPTTQFARVWACVVWLPDCIRRSRTRHELCGYPALTSGSIRLSTELRDPGDAACLLTQGFAMARIG